MRAIQRQYGGANTVRRQTPRDARSIHTPSALQTPGPDATPITNATHSHHNINDNNNNDDDSNQHDDNDNNNNNVTKKKKILKSVAAVNQANNPEIVDVEGNPVDTSLRLDQFVHKYTSEDNASYDQIAERDHKRFRERNAWVEEAVTFGDKQLALPQTQERGKLQFWKVIYG